VAVAQLSHKENKIPGIFKKSIKEIILKQNNIKQLLWILDISKLLKV
jgi:hypothetical protein